MKTIEVTMRCEAVVTELWTFEVADDFDIADAEEAFWEWNGGDQAPPTTERLRWVNVADISVDDEHDREFVKAQEVARV